MFEKVRREKREKMRDGVEDILSEIQSSDEMLSPSGGERSEERRGERRECGMLREERRERVQRRGEGRQRGGWMKRGEESERRQTKEDESDTSRHVVDRREEDHGDVGGQM